jgi:hypothetical protein
MHATSHDWEGQGSRPRRYNRSDVIAAALAVLGGLAALGLWATQHYLAQPTVCSIIADDTARLACYDSAYRTVPPARGETAPAK